MLWLLLCFRTLEYLIRHLARVATHHRSTGMTAKNLAIVWAPNLVRNQELEMGGVAALQVREWDAAVAGTSCTLSLAGASVDSSRSWASMMKL